MKLVCEALGVERSSFYAHQGRAVAKAVPLKLGPRTPVGDDELLQLIKDDLAASPFSGEGHRKVWARLRRKGYLPTSGWMPSRRETASRRSSP